MVHAQEMTVSLDLSAVLPLTRNVVLQWAETPDRVGQVTVVSVSGERDRVKGLGDSGAGVSSIQGRAFLMAFVIVDGGAERWYSTMCEAEDSVGGVVRRWDLKLRKEREVGAGPLQVVGMLPGDLHKVAWDGLGQAVIRGVCPYGSELRQGSSVIASAGDLQRAISEGRVLSGAGARPPSNVLLGAQRGVRAAVGRRGRSRRALAASRPALALDEAADPKPRPRPEHVPPEVVGRDWVPAAPRMHSALAQESHVPVPGPHEPGTCSAVDGSAHSGQARGPVRPIQPSTAKARSRRSDTMSETATNSTSILIRGSVAKTSTGGRAGPRGRSRHVPRAASAECAAAAPESTRSSRSRPGEGPAEFGLEAL